MALSSVIRKIKKAEALLVTPKIIDHLIRHPEGVVWDDAAYALWHKLTAAHESNEDRSGRFGASSRGRCPRAQIFGYLGMPEEKVQDPQVTNLFMDGKWRHLRWQMMGIQSGALTHVEYPYAYPKLRVAGKMDGLNSYERFGFELKGDRYYARSLDGVPDKHDLQIHTMMLATGWDTFAYIIESKETNDWREIVVHRDPKVISVVRTELEDLNEHIEDHRLPPVLPACAARQGPYRTCPFASNCLRRDRERGNDWPVFPGDWDS